MSIAQALLSLLHANGTSSIRRKSNPDRSINVKREVNYAGVYVPVSVFIQEDNDTFPLVITESDVLADDWELVI